MRSPRTRFRFEHVLVPVDLGSEWDDIFEAVRELALRNRWRLTLLHVVQVIDEDSDPELDDFYADLESTAREKLSAAARRFVEAGLQVEQQVVVGRPAQTIVEYTAREGVDLVVLSSPRVDLSNPEQPWSRLGYQISILSQCPVLVLK